MLQLKVSGVPPNLALPCVPHLSFSVHSVYHPCCFLCPSSSASDPPATPKNYLRLYLSPFPLLISITTSQPQNTATSRPAKSNHLLPGPRTAAGALVSTYPSENPFSFLNSSNKYINVLWESENTPQSDLHPHPGPVNVTHEDMILYHPSGLSIPSPVCV